MRNLAVIFTSAALSFGVLSAAFPGAAASPQVDPPSSCIKWVPTASVQLAAASLAADKPTPDPDPDPVIVPHPDKEKCPCKGTGVIIHGDGHKTECPYHGKAVTKATEHRCQCDRPGYYCACEKKYGGCQCPPLTTSKTEQSSGG